MAREKFFTVKFVEGDEPKYNWIQILDSEGKQTRLYTREGAVANFIVDCLDSEFDQIPEGVDYTKYL